MSGADPICLDGTAFAAVVASVRRGALTLDAAVAELIGRLTEAEVLCHEAPYLPRNVPGSVRHLPAGTAAAHVDLHFRCGRLRVLPLCRPLFAVYSDANNIITPP